MRRVGVLSRSIDYPFNFASGRFKGQWLRKLVLERRFGVPDLPLRQRIQRLRAVGRTIILAFSRFHSGGLSFPRKAPKYMHTTSRTLLEKLRQPNENAAWARFVELYTPFLFSWARRLGLQDSDAADLVQEVFTLLLDKLPLFAYDGGKSFRGWLRTVALNQWRATCRKRVNAPAGGGIDPENLQAPSEEAFWEEEYRKHLVGRALALMQAEFQPTTWKACWECVVNDRPAPEVAAELGLNPGAVRAAKFRVISRLRQELDGLLD